MEKYSQWRDAGTGIAPFYPVPFDTHGMPNAVGLALGVLLVLLRAPFLLIWGVLHVLVVHCLVGFVLKARAPLIYTAVRQESVRCALWIAGVHYVMMQREGGNRLIMPVEGDIVVANHSSPLDVVILDLYFQAQFTQSFSDDSRVQPLTYWQALRASVGGPEAPRHGLVSLSDLCHSQARKSIVVVFPEGTTSNGRGLLAMCPSAKELPANRRVFPISIKCDPADITTPIETSLVRVGLRIMASVSHGVRARIGPMLDLDGASAKSDRVADALSRLGRLRRLRMGVEDKAGFSRAWKRK